MLTTIPPDSVLASVAGVSFSFLSIVSFEERASAWAEFMASRHVQPERVFLIDYETIALPADRDRLLRKRCRSAFSKAFAPSRTQFLNGINAFAVNSLQEVMAQILEECDRLPLVMDISCMTRVHLLAVVAALYDRTEPREVYFCYSVPASYGFRPEDRSAWRDVLFVPAGSRWTFKREGQSRGIVLAGHDAERLSVALGELEPASGTLIYCGNPKRPDFLRRAREVNAKIERRLLQLRMPRFSGQPGAGDGWTVASIDVGDFQALSTTLQTQVSEAKREQSPVILFPYGPKPDSLAVALLLREWDIGDAWAVYPVPKSFSTAYSEGVAELQAFCPVGSARATTWPSARSGTTY